MHPSGGVKPPLESMVLRIRRVLSGEVTASLEASVDLRNLSVYLV